MPRPRSRRRINFDPGITYYKPRGIPLMDIEEVYLSLDEIEALRLKDYLGMEQNECAEKMEISQPTFHRILKDARKKVSDAIINGKAIRIDKRT